MNTPDLQERLRRATWAAPSPELRARVMTQANVVVAPIVWTDRIWFSRGWRRGALGTAIVLLAIAVWPLSSAPERSLTTQAVAAARAAEEVVRDAGLDSEMAAAVARRAANRSRPPAPARDLMLAGSLSDGGDR